MIHLATYVNPGGGVFVACQAMTEPGDRTNDIRAVTCRACLTAAAMTETQCAEVRPSWDATWLAVAQQVAKRSLCSRAQVGAVIVTAGNRVVATGYNGPPAGFFIPDHITGTSSLTAQYHGKQTCEHWCERAKPMAGPYAHLPEPFRSDPTWTDPRLREFYHAPSLSGQLWPGGPALSPTYDDCPSLHAEANALMAADRSTWQGGTVYVTGDVCHACAKLLANSGLARVVVQRDGVDRSYRTAEVGYDLLRACGLTVEVLDHEQEGEPT